MDFIKMFEDLHAGVKSGDSRYELVSHEHVRDADTGLNYHLYDDSFKIKKGDFEIDSKFINRDEQHVLMLTKRMIDNTFRDIMRKHLYDIFNEGHRQVVEQTKEVISAPNIVSSK